MKNIFLHINLALLATLMSTTVYTQLEDLTPILGLEEISKLTRKDQHNIKEIEDYESYVDIEE